MSELEDALQRARTELAETKAAIKAARGETLDALATQLAALQAETAELDAEADALDAELRPLREEEQRALEKLTPT